MNQHAKRRQASRRTPPGQDQPDDRRARPAPPSPSALERSGGTAAYTVAEEEAGSRLDRFLATRAQSAGDTLSRSRLKNLITEGRVLIDASAERDAAFKVRQGQEVLLEVPAPRPASPTPETMALPVVFEDADLIVIDKPAGLVVHPAAGHAAGTLVNALLAHCGDQLSGIGGVKRPGIVHRLDKDTSGLMVVAKSAAAHRGLVLLFADHGRTLGLVREYLALVWDAPERSAGVVDAPIGRHPHHRKKQAVVRGQSGRHAVTRWKVERVFSSVSGAGAALVRCRLETGRTHQIRVHMAHLGHPILGDQVYGAGFRTKAERLGAPARAALEALGRQALHAAVLGFPHPISGEILRFERAPPPGMARLIGALGDEQSSVSHERRPRA